MSPLRGSVIGGGRRRTWGLRPRLFKFRPFGAAPHPPRAALRLSPPPGIRQARVSVTLGASPGRTRHGAAVRNITLGELEGPLTMLALAARFLRDNRILRENRHDDSSHSRRGGSRHPVRHPGREPAADRADLRGYPDGPRQRAAHQRRPRAGAGRGAAARRALRRHRTGLPLQARRRADGDPHRRRGAGDLAGRVLHARGDAGLGAPAGGAPRATSSSSTSSR